MTWSMREGSVEAVSQDKDEALSSHHSGYAAKMFNVAKELCFVLAVAFTAYATVINTHTRTKKGPPPVPFFSLGSAIADDFYRGDLIQLMQRVSNSELAFVMFYAPWDADSQDARDGFEEGAKFYYNQIYFAGVNCWEPGSECRSTFKDISSFPQLVAYSGPRKAIEYRGPYDGDHIINFLHSLLHPLQRVNTVADVWRLRYLNHAVVVGHLKFNGMYGGKGYRAMYETALRFAGRDYERYTAFAVFTHDKVNGLMDVAYTPTIVLYLWDKRLEYSGELELEALYKWVVLHTSKSLAMLNADSLLPHAGSTAVMLMFTPRHPLAIINPYYQMMRRVAIKFYSCGNSSSLAPDHFLSHLLNHDQLYFHYEQEVLRADRMLRDECAALRRPKFERCTTVSPRPWNNVTCYDTCLSTPRPRLLTVRSSGEDWRSSAQLMLNLKEEQCRLVARTPPIVYPRASAGGGKGERPTACLVNTTFSFLALDSARHAHLAAGLGIDLKRRKHNTAVIIFTKEESLHLETEEVSEDTVSALLGAYVSGKGKRFVRSSRVVTPQQQLPQDSIFSLQELNTRNFNSVVLNETQSVVVLYYSGYCSFCTAVSSVFLSLGYLLRHLPRITLARVDGEHNDLPWQYTVHSYPSIIIFPKHRKSESRIFPDWLAITMHSLSNFILSNLPVEERVQGMLAICNKWGDSPDASKEGERCVRNVRISCLEMIAQTLKDYRSFSVRLKHNRVAEQRKRLRSLLKALLLRLQFLKSAHIGLERVPHLGAALRRLQRLSARTLVH